MSASNNEARLFTSILWDAGAERPLEESWSAKFAGPSGCAPSSPPIHSGLIRGATGGGRLEGAQGRRESKTFL